MNLSDFRWKHWGVYILISATTGDCQTTVCLTHTMYHAVNNLSTTPVVSSMKYVLFVFHINTTSRYVAIHITTPLGLKMSVWQSFNQLLTVIWCSRKAVYRCFEAKQKKRSEKPAINIRVHGLSHQCSNAELITGQPQVLTFLYVHYTQYFSCILVCIWHNTSSNYGLSFPVLHQNKVSIYFQLSHEGITTSMGSFLNFWSTYS